MKLYDKEFKYAVFDFDGTLANTVCIWQDVFDEYFVRRKIALPDDNSYDEEHIDFDLPVLAKYTRKKYFPNEKEEDILKEWQSIFENIMSSQKDLRLFSIDLLETLLTYDVKVAVITKYDLNLFKTFLKRNNIFDYISFIAEKDKTGDICCVFDSLINKIGGSKEDTIVVEAELENLKTLMSDGYFVVGMSNYLLTKNRKQHEKNCNHFFNEPLELSSILREQNYLEEIKIDNYRVRRFIDGYELLGLVNENVDTLYVPKLINGKMLYRIAREAFREKAFDKVILEEGLIYIDVEAFDHFKGAKEIVFPKSLREISTYGFIGSSFERIVFKGYIPICLSCFGGMPNLKEIVFSPDFKCISFRLFWLNSSLKELKFVEGLELIETQAFNKCENLKVIYLPKSIKRIQDNAFYRCYNLEKVYYNGSKEDREKISIDNEDDGNIKLLEAEWIYAE